MYTPSESVTPPSVGGLSTEDMAGRPPNDVRVHRRRDRAWSYRPTALTV